MMYWLLFYLTLWCLNGLQSSAIPQIRQVLAAAPNAIVQSKQTKQSSKIQDQILKNIVSFHKDTNMLLKSLNLSSVAIPDTVLNAWQRNINRFQSSRYNRMDLSRGVLSNTLDPKDSLIQRSMKYVRRCIDSFSVVYIRLVDFLSSSVIDICSKVYQKAIIHRRTITALGVMGAIGVVGYKVFKWLELWYKSLAEYELLLDDGDLYYQEYGKNVMDKYEASFKDSHRNFTSRYYSQNINKDVAQTDMKVLDSLHEKVSAALDMPVFPRTMSDYVDQSCKDIIDIMKEFEQGIKRREHLKLQAKSNEDSQLNDVDFEAYQGILNGILIVQARQSDATLRLLRLELLSAANTCEDLLVYWKKRLITRSQSLRLPFVLSLPSKILDARKTMRYGMERLKSGICHIPKVLTRPKQLSTNISNTLDISTTIYSTVAATDPVAKDINDTTNSSQLLNMPDDSFEGGSTLSRSLGSRLNDASYNMINAARYFIGMHPIYSRKTHDEGQGEASNSKTTFSEQIMDSINDTPTRVPAAKSIESYQDMNPSQKVKALENMLTELYREIGRIQRHSLLLYDMQSQRSSDMWRDLDEWSSDAVTISQGAMQLLQYDKIKSEVNIGLERTESSPSQRVSPPNQDRDVKQTVSISKSINSPMKQVHSSQRSMKSLDQSQSSIRRLQQDVSDVNDSRPSIPISKDDLSPIVTKNLYNMEEFIVDYSLREAIERVVVDPALFLRVYGNRSIAPSSQLWYPYPNTSSEDVSRTKLWYRVMKLTSTPHARSIPMPTLISNIMKMIPAASSNAIADKVIQILDISEIYQSKNVLNGWITMVSHCLYRDGDIERNQTIKIVLEGLESSDHIDNTTANASRGHNISTLPSEQATKVTISCGREEIRENINHTSSLPFLRGYLDHFRGRQGLNSNISSRQVIDSLKRSLTDQSSKISSLNSSFLGNTSSMTELIDAFGGPLHHFETQTRTSEDDDDHDSNYDNEDDQKESDPEIFEANQHQHQHISKSLNGVYSSNVTSIHSNDSSTSQRILLLRRSNGYREKLSTNKRTARFIKKSAFNDKLEFYGLRTKPSKSSIIIKRLFSIGFWVRFSLISGLIYATAEAVQRPDDVEELKNTILTNIQYFVRRRIIIPSKSILNDMILNRRVSITDKEALADAQRSLSNMIYDFLVQHRSKMSESEKRRVSKNMDMSPISLEYERELRRPIQNIVSGRIARIVLIQLQFLKKELLVAMQAIDELFNANQVNLQLLAVTPAILLLFVIQISSKMVVSGIKSSSRGKFIESTSAVYRDLRHGVRDLEKLLLFAISPSNDESSSHVNIPVSLSSHLSRDQLNKGMSLRSEASFVSKGSTVAERSAERDSYRVNDSSNRMISRITDNYDLNEITYGKMMSILHRLHSILVLNSSQFTHESLRFLQEDLRDLTASSLTLSQRILLLERIVRSYPFLQNHRSKSWTGSLLP